MGHVFDFHDARAFDAWLRTAHHQRNLTLQHHLLVSLLQPAPGETVLDIGCGSGATMAPLCARGLDVTGIDPSPYMLDLAFAQLGSQAALYRGVAEDLPFEDNSFNHAVLNTTLEFVESPRQALAEACRVAKDRVFVGFTNRYALGGPRLAAGGDLPPVFRHARSFSVWKLKRMVHDLLGQVPVSWRTSCLLGASNTAIARRIDRSELIQRCPFGAYAGMLIVLMPRLRTRPLAIAYRPNAAATELLAHWSAGST
jgi:SAM-dependent methyltransferase